MDRTHAISLAKNTCPTHGISHVHHSHPELIMGERLLKVHKAHTAWLLVLACLVHQYSEIRDLVSCPPSLPESPIRLQFPFWSSLGSFLV